MEFSAFIHPIPERISSLHPLGWREIRIPFPVSAHPLLQTLAVAATTCRRIARRAKAKGVAEYAIGYIAAKYAIEYTRPRQQPPLRAAPKRKGRNPRESRPLAVAYAAPGYAATALAFFLRAPCAGNATIDLRFARWQRPHDAQVTSSR